MPSLLRAGYSPRASWFALFGVLVSTASFAQQSDLTPGVTYVCNGERMFVENCNIRDTSDSANCMVGHPDHVGANGLMQYTTMSRGALKKLFPTCTQPSAKQVAAAQAMQKKQQDIYNANAQRAEEQLRPATQPVAAGPPPPSKDPQTRAMNRCITAGRLPSSCTGNALLGAFGQMLSAVLPSGGETEAQAGPTMAGVFAGAGGWRLDFIDGGVLVNCSGLSPNQEAYTLNLNGARPILTIRTRPRPLVLTLRADGAIVGPGPVTIEGVVPGGYTAGSSTAGHNESSTYTTTERMSANQVQPASGNSTNTYAGGGAYDVTTTHTSNNYVPGTSTPGYTNFVPRRATCPALDLHSTGTAGIQTMQTDLLKSMLGGDKGPPTPSGIRMHGIYASSTGFSVQFFPESAVLGCGPDAARAYPYTVLAEGSHAVVKIAAADHPLNLVVSSANTLDAGTGMYEVHGRFIAGQNDDGDFTFGPMERSCALGVLSASKEIPASGGTEGAAMGVASSAGGANGGAPAAGPPTGAAMGLATPQAPLGNATLLVVSGLPAQAGAANPLAGRPYILLRESYVNLVTNSVANVPPGVSAYRYGGQACATNAPDCGKINAAVKSSAASAVRADGNGSGTFPGVPPGTYYLMISTRYNNQPYAWGQAVVLKPGANRVTLELKDATLLN